ncbi:MAG: Pyrazinamidase [uncultured bacterium (gcode 4)]|uniref:nicotinamidase n=1 Tax=uncultured bacterium (gcode 4) TaxID=1234023 RepID=K2G419_9BACT|nr:MAG: Pyrazinamidase [uncultured bacterium (gcode 4)]
MKKEALIIVDAQKDFWENGWNLYVNWAESIVAVINKLIDEVKARAGIIISSRDWHPENHSSFSIWPSHCVQNTHWAEYMDWLNQDEIDYEVMKWFRPDKDSYSAFWWFEFRNWNPLRELKEILRSYEIQVIKIVWLATDYCVKATVLEALELGFEVEVVEAWIMAVDVNPNDWKAAIDEMKDKGAKFI